MTSWSDTEKDRSYEFEVPLPTAEHQNGGAPTLHSVEFEAQQGEKFLVTMNVPGMHYVYKLSNAARLQVQPAEWEPNSPVEPQYKTHYNERIYYGHRQTGHEALWQMVYTAPTTGRHVARAHCKPYGYWYDHSVPPESIIRKETFTYTAESYVSVTRIDPSSREHRQASEVALDDPGSVYAAGTGRFSVSAGATRIQHVGQAKISHCGRYAGSGTHPCHGRTDSTDTRFRVRGVLVQYAPDGTVLRALHSRWVNSAVGNTATGTRGHENVRSYLSVPDPLADPGGANRFAASTQVQWLAGGGLWIEQSSTATLIVVT